ncbi:MAG: hypothetical protein FLDDKLPJ_02313 [Phycisphaerae bacterium]|nr:hypothetical protein [Phycisphaerae bacterium]
MSFTLSAATGLAPGPIKWAAAACEGDPGEVFKPATEIQRRMLRTALMAADASAQASSSLSSSLALAVKLCERLALANKTILVIFYGDISKIKSNLRLT